MTFRDIVGFRRPEHPAVNARLALAGLAAGAAVVALFEPRGGARRRGRVVQKTIHTGKALEDGPVLETEANQLMQYNWAPGTRLLAIVFGSSFVASALRSRRPAPLTLGAAGALLALRGFTNLPVMHLLGLGARHRAVDPWRSE